MIMKDRRAKANNDEVGQLRYRTYKLSIDRINSSIDLGYYLEAITLCESLIADRLESRLNYLTQSDKYSFSMLFDMQNKISELETEGELNLVVNERLHAWRKKRNHALHQMAKIREGDNKEWEDKIADCKTIAIEGNSIRKEVFRLTDIRRK